MHQKASPEIVAKKHIIRQSVENSIIGFDRRFVDFGAGINGALMLSQALYWTDKAHDPEGWFWKTQAEWTKELGLSISEQRGAAKKLSAGGYLKIQRRGVPARNYYQVNLDLIMQKLNITYSDDKLCEFSTTSAYKSSQHSITENTSEIKSNITQYPVKNENNWRNEWKRRSKGFRSIKEIVSD